MSSVPVYSRIAYLSETSLQVKRNEIFALNASANCKDMKNAFKALVQFESSAEGSTSFCPITSFRHLSRACKSCSDDIIFDVLNYLKTLQKSNPEYKFLTAINCIIVHFVNKEDRIKAKGLFEAMHSYHLKPDTNSFNAAIYAHIKSKEVKKAIELEQKLKEADTEQNSMTCELMVKAYVIAEKTETVVSIIRKMMEKGFTVRRNLLNSVLNCPENKTEDEVLALAEELNIQLSRVPRHEEGLKGFRMRKLHQKPERGGKKLREKKGRGHKKDKRAKEKSYSGSQTSM
ncbi:hypothetical protein POM88_049296 [Heracleum sosnowskyi]|uniref:Pentatricopeptide repeat-containing protein n=1 Tax=Heracleum sosnowskyi TaxID=360622 RepID=A0AAD8LZD7_9APIA|nr:hypothetical protein POM88_049296 [Heracleum sosnowskyi]